MNLSEIFYSIQGESTYAGLPCIFIRFSGCNLRCSYCDSKYSYETNFSLSVPEILKELEKYKPANIVEITGGEPLLQEKIYQLFDDLYFNGYKILLETNGSISLEKVPDFVVKIVDIKCPASNEEVSFYKGNIQYIHPQNDNIKFVISNRADYDWVMKRIEEYQIQDYNIILSCVFQYLEPRKLAAWILEDKLYYRMQLQLQKYIWNPQKRRV
ncbi:MAG: radical SAM protein [Candidatus Cloacimonetes bacterium]|nr:radical SAM protein [Candidatus Cloacimonadota bacterium]